MDLLARVRKLCLALPETAEVEAWGRPTFRVGTGRKMFCMAADDGATITVKADPMEREALLAGEDERFYLPAYVGKAGWVGMRLDLPRTPWDEAAELIATSYCLVAPKKLADEVTAPPSLGDA